MMKFLTDILQIAIAMKILYMVVKWAFFRKRRKTSRKSVVSKIGMLISNRIHYTLNCKLTAQKEALQLSVNKSKTSNPNVVQFRKKTN